MAALLVAALAAGALLLLTPGPPRLRATSAAPRGHGPVLLTAGAAATVSVLAHGSTAGLVLPLLGLALTVAVVRAVSARRRDRAATDVRHRVVDLCDALRSELAAGQTPAAALDRAAVEWPLVAPAARAARAGGDVVASFRSLAAAPGGDALRVVAGAWQVAHRTGHGLADTLARVAADLRAGERTRRIVGGELASARATARLLAALPGLALVLGSGAGADPLRFLLGQPRGLACLVGGLAAGYAGLVWIEAIARDIERHG
ncbi:type II secretion system F family protein [Nocardioides nitrophenolicus]|uniref:type II secretion system F family protein n=1 Tax=Nocardioides nitrophenolicus TaxID=60489 RepID=UPI0019572576|nr:type II secretion system F family protein [Nocardioides nitrophenolicus]MBM7517234.1 tight adherence protein B [Nocardioides nitrophenolicus]